MQKDCSVVILAAGYSSRMRRLKIALTLDNGTTFIENIVKQYADFGCREIIIVVNNKSKEYLEDHPIKDVILAINHHPEFERFYSIKTGLSNIIGKFPVFIHNADNPFANQEVLKTLFINREDADFIKPIINTKGGHPILISKRIVNDIILSENHNIHLNNFLKKYSCKEIEMEDKKILVNVNTESEYKKL